MLWVVFIFKVFDSLDVLSFISEVIDGEKCGLGYVTVFIVVVFFEVYRVVSS